ncbi:hypothetical protein SOASR029_39800 [Budvicia aquatica]|nr:hypothetical protein SOASR029_39800 [Budvicia aquatica]
MIWEGSMPIVRNSKSAAILAVALLLLPATLLAADNNTVRVTAEITKGSCEFSTSTDSVEFTPQTVSSFSSGNAAAVMPLTLQYHCEGYEANAKIGIAAIGVVSPDDRLFLSSASTAAGVGFMLKNGVVTDKAGFYSTGTTVKNGAKFSVDMATQGEHPLTVGFVKQNTSTAVTSGDVKASIMFMFVMP